jgi:hypothetical protein
MVEARRDRLNEQDAMIWDILMRAQARELERIIGRTEAPPPRPSPKRKRATPSG